MSRDREPLFQLLDFDLALLPLKPVVTDASEPFPQLSDSPYEKAVGCSTDADRDPVVESKFCLTADRESGSDH